MCEAQNQAFASCDCVTECGIMDWLRMKNYVFHYRFKFLGATGRFQTFYKIWLVGAIRSRVECQGRGSMDEHSSVFSSFRKTKHMSWAEVKVQHAALHWADSSRKNIIFLFPVTKVSFETYTSQIIPGRDRTWSGMIILIVKTQRDKFGPESKKYYY